MFFAMVSLKSCASWVTTPTNRRRSSVAISFKSIPSTVTRPDVGSAKRARSALRVVFPLPVPPTTATVFPRGSSKLTWSTAGFFAVSYVKETSSNRTPSRNSRSGTGRSGSGISIRTSIREKTRDSAAIPPSIWTCSFESFFTGL